MASWVVECRHQPTRQLGGLGESFGSQTYNERENMAVLPPESFLGPNGATLSREAQLLLRHIHYHEANKGSFFWTPPSSASQRRALEFTITEVVRVDDGIELELYQELRCSCANVYWTSSVSVNGKKSNIRSVKKALQHLGERTWQTV